MVTHKGVPAKGKGKKEEIRFNDLWNETLEYFKNNFATLSFIGLLFSFLPAFYVGYNRIFDGIQGNFVTTEQIVPVLIFLAAMSLLYSLLSVSVTYMIKSKKKGISFMEVINSSSKYYWNAIILSIVLAIALLFLFLLLILPGIIFFIYWAFSFQVLVFEDSKIIESMKKSKSTVKGRWWNVLFMMLLIGIILGVLSAIAGLGITIIDKIFSSALLLHLLNNLIGMYSNLFMLVFIGNYYKSLRN